MPYGLLPLQILFEKCWQAEYPRRPIKSHQAVEAHASNLSAAEPSQLVLNPHNLSVFFVSGQFGEALRIQSAQLAGYGSK
jgi:hypothetical protein